MPILTTGEMKDLSKYLYRAFPMISCLFWIFSPAEGKTISTVVGSRVILHCNKDSLNTLNQLTWKMNSENLFTFNTEVKLHIFPEAHRLNLNMSESESQQYALVIESVKMSHEGNYTCEINTLTGAQEEKWELIITERKEDDIIWDKLVIAVAAAVPCVCCLIFIISLAILKRVCKQRGANGIHSPTAEMQQEQREDIYENCLESQRHGYNPPNSCKPRAH